MNITEKAVKVKAKRGELESQFPSGDCVVMSLPSDTFNTVGGVAMEVPVDIAARGIVDQTHRLATEDEAKAWRAEQAAKRRSIQEAAIAQPELLQAILQKAITRSSGK